MPCSTTLSFNPASSGGELFMDQAIYDATSDTIVGVRGQWAFQFNATTGAFIKGLKFTTNNVGMSTITKVGASLYIGTSWTPNNNLSSGTPFTDRDIYVVDSAAFTVSGRLGLGAHLDYAFGAAVSDYYGIGWRSLVTSGGLIYGLASTGDVFSVATNGTGYTAHSFGLAAGIAVDSTNGVLWLADPATPNIWAAQISPLFGNDCFDTVGTLQSISGICWNQSQNKVYVVDGTFNHLYVVNASGISPGFANFAVSTKTLSLINANPFKIKSVNTVDFPLNPLVGKVLIPCWSDGYPFVGNDSVIVWNPVSDTQDSVKSGFDSPFDIVSTPSKNWALQSGPVPLREII